MNISEKANLIIYRIREKGLEVFLVNKDKENNEEWDMPQGKLLEEKPLQLMKEERMIELDPVEQADGQTEQAVAVEGDWHDIPSLKGILYQDMLEMKDKIMEMEKGTFFVLKEAFKKVLPHQYEFLKELKDIITDRNSVRNI